MKTEQEIRKELRWCEECIENGDTTAWIQGRKYALLWVLGEEAE
jgi:hypothetical protein